ncbi:MAG: hypothetical protein HGA47_03310, partial [Zoogloea sp.]|nr:hypothetical protein [Zoogloea sp.]
MTLNIGRGRTLLIGLATLLLAACGGGGGGGSGTAGDAPLLPTLSQDINPEGTRVDVSGRNYFPLNRGDTWNFDVKVNGTTVASATRTTVAGPDASGLYTLDETVSGGSTNRSLYRNDGQGPVMLDPTGAQYDAPGVYAALPQLLEYPMPFYPVGGVRKIIRQGSTQVDLDNDGKNDYFRVEFTQVFRGFETLTILGQPMEVAHFSTTMVQTAVSTSHGSYTFNQSEEAYLASNMGLVKADRATSDSNGQSNSYSMELTSATIGGQNYAAGVDPNATLVTLTLPHNAIAYDTTRGVYYATVPASAASHANSIATVNATTGAIAYSSAIGSDPGPLAISADGSTLYVGLNGAGQVLKLSAPSMAISGRLYLPVDAYPAGQLYAEDISISPVDPTVFAVSLSSHTVSPRNQGVGLVRNMVLQPQRTQLYTLSSINNHITFDETGNWVFGIDLETSGAGLNRIQVQSNGLSIVQSTPTRPSGLNGLTKLKARDGILPVGAAAFSADSSMALLGTVNAALNCQKVSGSSK